jgi:hypothetical protein
MMHDRSEKPGNLPGSERLAKAEPQRWLAVEMRLPAEKNADDDHDEARELVDP